MTALTVVNALLLTMTGGQDPFHGWLTAGADGRITGIGAGEPPAPDDGPPGEVLDARGRIVAPGFISAHSHLHTSGMRGIAAAQRAGLTPPASPLFGAPVPADSAGAAR